MDTATTSEGRLGSRLCFTCSLVTVRVQSLRRKDVQHVLGEPIGIHHVCTW